MVARSKTAAAQSQVHDALKSIDIMDPTSEVGRFEEKIRREEAKVLGQQELAASSLDAQFNQPKIWESRLRLKHAWQPSSPVAASLPLEAAPPPPAV